MSLKDSLLAFVIVAIWGFNFIVIAWGLAHMPPLMMGAGRFLFVGVIGCLLVKRPNIKLRWLALYALTLCFGQFALLFCAIAFGMPAGLASLVLQSQALFTIVLSALLLSEAIKPAQLLAMLVAGAGLTIIGLSEQATQMTAIGFALTIASAALWGSGNVINRKINQAGYLANAHSSSGSRAPSLRNNPGLGLVVWSSWFALIPFAVASLLFEGSEAIVASLAQFNLTGFGVLLYLSVCASMLGYSLWSYLLTRYPAGQVAPLTLAVPVVGLLCAMVFLNEQVTSGQWLGIVVVMFGLVINMKGERLAQLFKLKVSRNAKG
ncbi:O-acetylserine/cysteine exporter [Thalassotalea euphylliae]|uniref:O-acetylserine/cysteine exporter n=1 Tax=Thalassotalea euphylliae TaxID=1655234 RepID=A0A3E0TTE2_9GAMM|nr:EamA family transporter [Thalassotalea euphylliae]REL27808.1 O-acetylserine/cysteine exporter [Thalassotalea euphylliae]